MFSCAARGKTRRINSDLAKNVSAISYKVASKEKEIRLELVFFRSLTEGKAIKLMTKPVAGNFLYRKRPSAILAATKTCLATAGTTSTTSGWHWCSSARQDASTYRGNTTKHGPFRTSFKTK